MKTIYIMIILPFILYSIFKYLTTSKTKNQYPKIASTPYKSARYIKYDENSVLDTDNINTETMIQVYLNEDTAKIDSILLEPDDLNDPTYIDDNGSYIYLKEDNNLKIIYIYQNKQLQYQKSYDLSITKIQCLNEAIIYLQTSLPLTQISR